MQALPGFRDFFPEDFARRKVICDAWRAAARSFGFEEYDGPALESLELYAKKNESGSEILDQLFQFIDKGERHVALRPEMTPTLARMVASREKNYRKPLKWFSIAPFYRYEKQQKGRLREFLQFNCDILGDESHSADAEIIALAVESLRRLGLGADDFKVRLSDRNAWSLFLEKEGCDASRIGDFLQVIDKLERETPDALNARLRPFGVDLAKMRSFIESGRTDAFEQLQPELEARGLADFIETDLTIVRGLAYYTGLVFEIFAKRGNLRAVAGGGRYDKLLADLSDGSAALPAVGFGMGDVVLAHLIEESPAARESLEKRATEHLTCEVYIVVADPGRRSEALGIAADLRRAGIRTEYSLSSAKVGKQFQAAEASGARHAIVVGQEWPDVKIKDLAARTERSLDADQLRTGTLHATL